MDRFDKRFLIVLGVCVAVLGGVTTWYLVQSPEPVEPTPRDRVFATTTQFVTTGGDVVDITPAPGEYMVIHTWATWCPPCHQSLVDYGLLAESFADAPVRFLAINRKETPRTTAPLLERLQVSPALTILHDSVDHVFVETEGYAVPETVVFGPDGTIIYQERSTFRPEALRGLLRQSLSATQ